MKIINLGRHYNNMYNVILNKFGIISSFSIFTIPEQKYNWPIKNINKNPT